MPDVTPWQSLGDLHGTLLSLQHRCCACRVISLSDVTQYVWTELLDMAMQAHHCALDAIAAASNCPSIISALSLDDCSAFPRLMQSAYFTFAVAATAEVRTQTRP